MKGYQMVVIWLLIFFVIFYIPLRKLDISYKIIGYWCFFMVFIGIFEMMLINNLDRICEKGIEYYNNNKCYWTEPGKSFYDMITDKMYMELYSDYSLADCKYRKTPKSCGFRFVMVGEIMHGIISLIFAPIILFGIFFNIKREYLLLSILLFGVIQLTMITWYLIPVFWDMNIEESENYIKNDKWWFPPLFWNIPWFIIPPFFIYYGISNLLGGIRKNPMSVPVPVPV